MYRSLPPIKYTLHVMRILKVHSPKIDQSKFEILTPKRYLVISVSFNFRGRSVNYLLVFCSFIGWSYFWNKTFLTYSLYYFWSIWKVLFRDTKMFQIFRSWIFANRQINDVSIWVPGGNIRNITYDFWILQPTNISFL